MEDLEALKFDGVLTCGRVDDAGTPEFEARIVVDPRSATHDVAYKVHGRLVTRDDFRMLLAVHQERVAEYSGVAQEQDEAFVIAKREAEEQATQARHDEMLELLKRGLSR